MKRGILATRNELSELVQRIPTKPFDTIYESLRKRCALILESAPVTEAQWRTLWQQGIWNSATNAARTTQGRILDLLVAHHIEPNPAYRDRAIEELKNLIRWSRWVDPCHNHNLADICTAEAAVAATIALDWLWEDLHEADHEKTIKAIREKAIIPYCDGVAHQAEWFNCYHNWNAVVNSGIGLAGLAFSDEDESSGQAYKHARSGLKRFFSALGREGGWDEGTGLWGYAMRYVLLLAEAASRLLDDQTILHSRGMDATGLFGVYFTPNGQPASFGDAPAVPLYGTFYLLAKHFGCKETLWWLDTYSFHKDVSTTGYSAAGLALLFRPAHEITPKKPHLQPVKVFNEIGWAAIADSWPKPEFYVAAKTGDLSASHSQLDMNSIQLQVDGEMLLTDLGHAPMSREYFSEQRSEFYEVQAKAHNTITIDERDHRIDANGSIIDEQDGKDFRWIACDAGVACGDNVRFIRHLVMLVDPRSQQGKALIVLDELTNVTAEKVNLFWHTTGHVQFKDDTLSGSIVGKQAGLHFALASTAKLKGGVRKVVLQRRKVDSILGFKTAPTSHALFVSVFSRKKTPLGVELNHEPSGDVFVKTGSADIHFKPFKHNLRLDKVIQH